MSLYMCTYVYTYTYVYTFTHADIDLFMAHIKFSLSSTYGGSDMCTHMWRECICFSWLFDLCQHTNSSKIARVHTHTRMRAYMQQSKFVYAACSPRCCAQD